MSQLAEQPNSKTEDDLGQFNLEPKTARELFIVLHGQNAVLRNDIVYVNKRIDDMHAQVHQRFDDVNQRLNDVNQRFDETSRQINDMKITLRWLVGMAIAAIVTPIILRLLGN